MNSTLKYPIVSYVDIIDLFHSILFWRYEQKAASSIGPQFWFTSFDLVWTILDMNRILPKSRVKRLRGKRELCAPFLKKTLVVEQYDGRDWRTIMDNAGFRCFCLRKSNRELVSGNSVNHLELCSRRKVFITSFGIRTAPDVTQRVTNLLNREQFLSSWERYTLPFRDKKGVVGMLAKARNTELDAEIWGEKAAETLGGTDQDI